ncbi:unnamed protein product, partial [marine sediment metagenome]
FNAKVSDATLDTSSDPRTPTAHDHDSIYYTKTELNAGELDNRYYRENEFTETDGDAAKPVKTKAAGHLDQSLVKEMHQLSQPGEPTVAVGQVCMWTDTDADNVVHLLFGTEGGNVGVELTVAPS